MLYPLDPFFILIYEGLGKVRVTRNTRKGVQDDQALEGSKLLEFNVEVGIKVEVEWRLRWKSSWSSGIKAGVKVEVEVDTQSEVKQVSRLI